MKLRIEVVADTANLATVREFIQDAVSQSALPKEHLNKVVLAVDEAVANTIQHGYDGRDDGKIEIIVEADGERFMIRIVDDGLTFDASEGVKRTAKLNLNAHIDSGNKRGLGLFIMRKVMDEVRYSSREGRLNELTLVKFVQGSEE